MLFYDSGIRLDLIKTRAKLKKHTCFIAEIDVNALIKPIEIDGEHGKKH
jgi:hypothetical protein